MPVDSELFGDALPTYLSRFVGRQRDLTELRALCTQTTPVTLCGIGGLGKTRLAIELARSLRSQPGPLRAFDAVRWAPLIAVGEDEAVPVAVAAGLGLSVPDGRRATLAVVNELRGRRCLLVLDNAEQVVAGCRELLAELRRAGLDVLVLTTSRVPIGRRTSGCTPYPR